MDSISLGNMLIVWLVLWIAPMLLVALSRRGSGQERALWAVVCVFVSWLGFAGFLLSTRTSQETARG
jgi:hypothetical protein